MKVPHAENATVEIRKLRDYCLSPTHEHGRHKARLFAAALGLSPDDAYVLRDVLLEAVKTHDAQLGRRDEYGQRYIVDFRLEWRGKQTIVRSAWIVENSSETPRLTSCYPR